MLLQLSTKSHKKTRTNNLSVALNTSPFVPTGDVNLLKRVMKRLNHFVKKTSGLYSYAGVKSVDVGVFFNSPFGVL